MCQNSDTNMIVKEKRLTKAESIELKARIESLLQRLPRNYTAKMMQMFPKRYNSGNVYMLYNVVAKRRLDSQIISDLEKICL